MSEDLYAKPDLSRKAKVDRGETEERIVDIYVSADSLTLYDNLQMQGTTPPTVQATAGDRHPDNISSEKKRSCRAAAVCLGLLCLLLLAGIIGLVVQCFKDKTKWDVERNQLLANYNSLTTERENLNNSYNNVTEERDQCKMISHNLTEERDQLQTSYNDLTEERDQLQTSYNDLTEERDQLQTSYNDLTEERDQLLTNHKRFVNKVCNHLMLTENGASLLDSRMEEITGCPEGWQRFGCSCYYISTERKNWDQSRQDCLRSGADLVIIDSTDKQNFVQRFNTNKKRVWIGLTEKKNTWTWVDGTTLTSPEFWEEDEPRGSDKHCVAYNPGRGGWRDEACYVKLLFLCEKFFQTDI
ncbi:uncharacterized protein LOC139930195 [Centroberyx gerrardi]